MPELHLAAESNIETQFLRGQMTVRSAFREFERRGTNGGKPARTPLKVIPKEKRGRVGLGYNMAIQSQHLL